MDSAFDLAGTPLAEAVAANRSDLPLSRSIAHPAERQLATRNPKERNWPELD
jgi:hypothetical protein